MQQQSGFDYVVQTSPPSPWVPVNAPLEQHHNNQKGIFVWGCTGICAVTLVALLIIGIIWNVPWLGVFALVSLLPGLFIEWLIYWRHHKNKAQLNRVVKFIAIGMCGVVPLILVEYGLILLFGYLELEIQNKIPPLFDVFVRSFIEAFIVASLCEETFKYLVARNISVVEGRDVPYSVVIYSASSALGLASLENMMYIISASRNFWGGLFTAITRALLAVPLHATTGVIIGVSIAEMLFKTKQTNYFKIIWIPILLHGMYDVATMFPSFYVDLVAENYWIFMLFPISLVSLIVGIVYARKRVNGLLSSSHAYMPMYTLQPSAQL